jgi:hypothetical protein
MLMFLGVTLHSFVLHNPYVTQLCYGYFYGKWTQFVSRVRCMDLYKIFAQIAGRNPITITSPPPLQMRDPNSQLASPGEQEPARHCG